MIDFATEYFNIPLADGRRLIGEYELFCLRWRLQKKVTCLFFTRWATQKSKYAFIGDDHVEILRSLVGQEDYEKYILPNLLNK